MLNQPRQDPKSDKGARGKGWELQTGGEKGKDTSRPSGKERGEEERGLGAGDVGRSGTGGREVVRGGVEDEQG